MCAPCSGFQKITKRNCLGQGLTCLAQHPDRMTVSHTPLLTPRSPPLCLPETCGDSRRREGGKILAPHKGLLCAQHIPSCHGRDAVVQSWPNRVSEPGFKLSLSYSKARLLSLCSARPGRMKSCKREDELARATGSQHEAS